MNKKQKVIILGGIILVIAAIVFPPYKAQLFDFEYNKPDIPFWALYENGNLISQSTSIEFHYFFSPPKKIISVIDSTKIKEQINQFELNEQVMISYNNSYLDRLYSRSGLINKKRTSKPIEVSDITDTNKFNQSNLTQLNSKKSTINYDYSKFKYKGNYTGNVIINIRDYYTQGAIILIIILLNIGLVFIFKKSSTKTQTES